jgi:hypothetical protein
MSLFPKFKLDSASLATPATLATQGGQDKLSLPCDSCDSAAESRESRNTPVGENVAWPCPHCGREATIEAVEPSLDGERMLTFWHCEPCQSYAVTPSTIKEPPKGWGTKVRQ